MLSGIISAQIILNPSFEGPLGSATTPPNWSPCGTISTPDTQPGAFEVNTPPSEGLSYLGLVCREGFPSNPFQCESCQQDIESPFLPERCYRFSIDLAVSATMFASGFGDEISFAQPLKLKIWGGIFSCDEFTLMWESPMIDHTDWRRYYFDIKTENHQYNYLMLKADYLWAPTYYGNILIDNIRVLKDPELPKNLVICSDNPLEIKYTEGLDIFWTDIFNNDTITSPDTSGTYLFHANSGTCSSVDTINVSFVSAPPSTELTRIGDTLKSSVSSSEYLYQWYDDNTAIPGATTPEYRTVFSGNYSLIISDSTGNCQTVSSVFSINNPEINVFPNPSSGLFTLAVSNEGTSELSTEVFNVRGQLIYKSEKELITNNTLKEIDLRGVALGTYYIRVLINDHATTKKVSVLRTFGQ